VPFDRDLGTVRSPASISIGRNWMSFVGATPFFIAAKDADLALMRLLNDHGAGPKIPAVHNATPLMAAAGLGFWEGESPGPAGGGTAPSRTRSTAQDGPLPAVNGTSSRGSRGRRRTRWSRRVDLPPTAGARENHAGWKPRRREGAERHAASPAAVLQPLSLPP